VSRGTAGGRGGRGEGEGRGGRRGGGVFIGLRGGACAGLQEGREGASECEYARGSTPSPLQSHRMTNQTLTPLPRRPWHLRWQSPHTPGVTVPNETGDVVTVSGGKQRREEGVGMSTVAGLGLEPGERERSGGA